MICDIALITDSVKAVEVRGGYPRTRSVQPGQEFASSMLVAGIVSTALWITVVTVGIALVVIGRVKPGAAGQR